ncbi:hypothetical protein B0E51_17295 [Rhodanobacter sp. C05]|nr:hypothetical protein B0E51_17295 [Rhodanobacter sp. C05]
MHFMKMLADIFCFPFVWQAIWNSDESAVPKKRNPATVLRSAEQLQQPQRTGSRRSDSNAPDVTGLSA